MADTTRVQFNVSPLMLDLIDDAVDQTAAPSRAEVIRRALSIYSLLLREHRAGKSIRIVGGGEVEKIIVMPEAGK